MSLLQAIVLGVLQGLTEFLPVSSSGHLVLFQHLMGMKEPLLVFDVILHAGTLLAVLIYFRKELWQMLQETLIFIIRLCKGEKPGALFDELTEARLASYLIMATLPTGLIAIMFHDAFESMFGSIFSVGIAWLITGSVLILTRRLKGTRSLDLMNHQDAFVIGLMQGVAIVPGISRSGTTIVAGMFCGLEKKEAARFSFLMSIPAIIGANILEIKKGFESMHVEMLPLLAGLAAAGVAGYLSIAFLIRVIQRGNFFLFGFYCLMIGLFTIAYCVIHGGSF